jgi:WD40 repeat protein
MPQWPLLTLREHFADQSTPLNSVLTESAVVTASRDNTARLWNAATGKPLGEPLRHKDLRLERRLLSRWAARRYRKPRQHRPPVDAATASR